MSLLNKYFMTCVMTYQMLTTGIFSVSRGSPQAANKANIFLSLIEYELNSLLGPSHLVDHISVHIRFDLERYLLNIS